MDAVEPLEIINGWESAALSFVTAALRIVRPMVYRLSMTARREEDTRNIVKSARAGHQGERITIADAPGKGGHKAGTMSARSTNARSGSENLGGNRPGLAKGGHIKHPKSGSVKGSRTSDFRAR